MRNPVSQDVFMMGDYLVTPAGRWETKKKNSLNFFLRKRKIKCQKTRQEGR